MNTHQVIVCGGGPSGITAALAAARNGAHTLLIEQFGFAAVVIGGTRITGGHGTVIGTILGVALLALVKNNLIILGVPTHFQTFVVGMIIVFGTSITSIRAKRIAEQAKI